MVGETNPIIAQHSTNIGRAKDSESDSGRQRERGREEKRERGGRERQTDCSSEFIYDCIYCRIYSDYLKCLDTVESRPFAVLMQQHSCATSLRRQRERVEKRGEREEGETGRGTERQMERGRGAERMGQRPGLTASPIARDYLSKQ